MSEPQINIEEDLNEFLYNHSTYLQNNISLADSKSLLIITINSIITAFIYKELLNSTLKIDNTLFFILLFSAFLLLISYYFSLSVVIPRTNSRSGNGIIFWEDIINTSKEGYLKKVLETPSIANSMIEQNYYLAKILSKKYKNLKICFKFSLVSYSFLAFYGAINIFI